MRIMVLGNAQRQGVMEEAKQLLPFLREHCEVVIDDLLQSQDLSKVNADIALVLGGDGAILRAARQMGYRQTPVLGVNLGKLGFLADLNPDEVREVFPAVLSGQYQVTQHLMFECALHDRDSGEESTYLGLNEVTVQTGPPFPIIQLDLLINGEKVSRYNGDGLMLSTPIGSTAHNLSAGGPILGQDLAAFVITPICPHSLTARPLVDSAEKEYMIAIQGEDSHAMLRIDGQETIPLTNRHRVTVRKARVNFSLVKVPGKSYYQTLKDKLNWGSLPVYREE